MSLKELKARYGGTKMREAVNRAIRASCPGGAECLDALELCKQMLDRNGWREPDGQFTPLAVAYDRLLWIAGAMEDEIRSRYDLPPRVESDQLRR
jgi:hypothetical protein